MRLILNEQDIIDSVCVYIAVKENDDVINEDIAPEDVQGVELTHDSGQFFARGRIYGEHHRLHEQQIINAIAVFLRVYHSFDEGRLNIKLLFENEEFGADVIVE